MTLDVSALPPVLRTEQAAELLDIAPDTLLRLNRAGQAPVQPLHLGRALRWPTRPLLELVGLGRGEDPADRHGEALADPSPAPPEKGTDSDATPRPRAS